MIKNNWKRLIIIGCLFAIFMGMSMGIETLNKKAILAKDEKKTGKSDVALKADTTINQDEIVKKDNSDIYLVMSINPKFMLHVQGEVIDEVFQLNDDAKIFTNKDFKGITLKDAVLKINELLENNNYIKENSEISISIYDYNNIDMIEAINLVADFINGFTDEGLKVKSCILEEEEKMQIKTTLVNYKEKTIMDNRYEDNILRNDVILAYNKKPNVTNKNPQIENVKPEEKEEIEIADNNIIKDEELKEDNTLLEEPKEEIEDNITSGGSSSSSSPTIEYLVDDNKMNKIKLEEINSLFNSDKPQVLYVGSRFSIECYRFLPILKKVQENLGYVTNYLNMDLKEYYDGDDLLKEFALKINIPIIINNNETTVGEYFYKRRYTPMVIVIKNNKVVGAILGNKSENDLSKFIEDYYFNDKDDSIIDKPINPVEPNYDVSKMNVILLQKVNDIFNKDEAQVLFIGNKNCLNSSLMLKSLIKIQEELDYKTNYLELDKDQADLNADLKQLALKMNINVLVDGREVLLSEYFYNTKHTPVVLIIKNKEVTAALLENKDYDSVKEFVKNNIFDLEQEENEEIDDDIKEIDTVDLTQNQVLVIGRNHKELKKTSNFLAEFVGKVNYLNVEKNDDKVLQDLALIMDNEAVLADEKICWSKYLYTKKYMPIVLVIKDHKIVNTFISDENYRDIKDFVENNIFYN